MKINVPTAPIRTHEGGIAKHINPLQQLRRSVMSCLLWEKEFYEEGEDIAQRIRDGVAKVMPHQVADLAVEAREQMKLRHVPLLLAREMARLPMHKALVAKTLEKIIQRPDELAEFCAIWQKDDPTKPLSKSLSAQAKKGLAAAFPKFGGYQLAKYNRDGAVKLRDVLFLSHAKPRDDEQARLWKQLIDGTLPAPDTWEVALSAGADKKATWERLIAENNLGALALLRNLRNMKEAKVDDAIVAKAIDGMNAERVLPFRFIAAARYAPQFEPQLEQAMFRNLQDAPKLPGRTILLVDVSGSMDAPLSDKSDLMRLDAACGLAMLLREVCEQVVIATFSERLVGVPPRRGFALRDAIVNSQPHSGTYLGTALNNVLPNEASERIIVITDEQSADPVPDPGRKGYMLNVASAKNGVGYGPWLHLDGFSEAIVSYIIKTET